MNTIQKNVVTSIQLGIEDYLSADERRSLSAVHNLTAGLLQLFKEESCRLSPADSDEVLVKKLLRLTIGGDGFRDASYGKKTGDVPNSRRLSGRIVFTQR